MNHCGVKIGKGALCSLVKKLSGAELEIMIRMSRLWGGKEEEKVE